MLHPAIEKLIVLVAEQQVARALRMQKEKGPETQTTGPEVSKVDETTRQHRPEEKPI